jgi:3-oxoacyl-[acyl-carrier protein] reductase
MNESRRVAIITGSSRGVGAATARLFAQKHYHVVINYTKSEKEAHGVQADCEALGAETLLCRTNVSEDEDCRPGAHSRFGLIQAARGWRRAFSAGH